jgi:hypothetical protein
MKGHFGAVDHEAGSLECQIKANRLSEHVGDTSRKMRAT